MELPTIRTRTEGQIYSPFSGQAVDGEKGPNAQDPTLLFVHYGDADGFAYVAPRLLTQLEVELDELTLEEIGERFFREGAFVLEADAGWNGLNSYGFVPA